MSALVTVALYLCILGILKKYYTDGGNDIGAPKMRNKFWFNKDFLILGWQYWSFLNCFQYSYRSFNYCVTAIVDA